MTDTPTWSVTLEEDTTTGDLLLPIPDDLLKSMGWNEGDVLQWDDKLDGTFTLTKAL